MNHTPQIRRAIQFAARKHYGQMRRETGQLPYVSHLFSTAILVAEDGNASEEAVIAALLHDTIEDTGTTREEIIEEFGEEVADIVATVSEPKEIEGHKLEWKEQKKMYLAQVELGTDDALLVSIADKIDNIESKLDAVKREGPELLKKFHAPDELVWYHGAVLHMALERLPQHPLTKRLKEAHGLEIESLA